MERHKPLARHRPLKTSFAKQLRANATDAEGKLWSILRKHQFSGLRFRRQQPIGPYVVDFCCPAAKLIIELDGDQHGEDRVQQYDSIRTEWLTAHGYRVLRFANGDALGNPQVVLEAIAHALEIRAVPLPDPASSLGLRRIDPPSRGGWK